MRMMFALVLMAFTLAAQTPSASDSASASALDEKIAAHHRITDDTATLTSYVSHGLTLKALLYKPVGAGPFPVVLWNHGSEPMPGPQVELAHFYNAHGYVLFCPVRAGQGGNPGDYIVDEQHKDLSQSNALQERANDDVAAALDWIKAQPFVDPRRIAISGVSYGGIQTLLSAQRFSDVRAFVAFAPGAMSWANKGVQHQLEEAVLQAKGPVFLLQAANDFSTGPSETLGPLILAKGGLNRAKLYPRFGAMDKHQLGHAGFATWDLGTQIWGPDVLAFLDAAMPPAKS